MHQLQKNQCYESFQAQYHLYGRCTRGDSCRITAVRPGRLLLPTVTVSVSRPRSHVKQRTATNFRHRLFHLILHLYQNLNPTSVLCQDTSSVDFPRPSVHQSGSKLEYSAKLSSGAPDVATRPSVLCPYSRQYMCPRATMDICYLVYGYSTESTSLPSVGWIAVSPPIAARPRRKARALHRIR